MDLRTNRDYFPIQHWRTGFYNREEVCLLRGTNWIFNNNSSYVFCMDLRKKKTAIIFLYRSNWRVYITVTERVYCAVRTEYLRIIQVTCFVWISEQTEIIFLYSIDGLAFITERECVYCAVRTEYLILIQATCFVWISEKNSNYFPIQK